MGNAETVVGLGIDICSWDRVPDFDESHPFYRIFPKREIDACLARSNPRARFASRFAAREALVKALGGIAEWMKEIEVVNDGDGSPRFDGPTPDHLNILLSISSERGFSIACVVVSRNEVR